MDCWISESVTHCAMVFIMRRIERYMRMNSVVPLGLAPASAVIRRETPAYGHDVALRRCRVRPRALPQHGSVKENIIFG